MSNYRIFQYTLLIKLSLPYNTNFVETTSFYHGINHWLWITVLSRLKLNIFTRIAKGNFAMVVSRFFPLIVLVKTKNFGPESNSCLVYAPPVNWQWLDRFNWLISRLDKDKIRKIVLCQKKLTEIEKMGRSGKGSKSGSEMDGPTMSDSMSTSKLNSQTQRYWPKSLNYIYLDSIFSVSFVQFRNHKQHPALERQMSDVSYKLLMQLLVDLFFYLVIRGCKKGWLHYHTSAGSRNGHE